MGMEKKRKKQSQNVLRSDDIDEHRICINKNFGNIKSKQ